MSGSLWYINRGAADKDVIAEVKKPSSVMGGGYGRPSTVEIYLRGNTRWGLVLHLQKAVLRGHLCRAVCLWCALQLLGLSRGQSLRWDVKNSHIRSDFRSVRSSGCSPSSIRSCLIASLICDGIEQPCWRLVCLKLASGLGSHCHGGTSLDSCEQARPLRSRFTYNLRVLCRADRPRQGAGPQHWGRVHLPILAARNEPSPYTTFAHSGLQLCELSSACMCDLCRAAVSLTSWYPCAAGSDQCSAVTCAALTSARHGRTSLGRAMFGGRHS